MNTKAREALVAAALSGRPQIRGRYHREDGLGDCALGILHELDPSHTLLICGVENHAAIGLTDTPVKCPVEGCQRRLREVGLVAHLNDEHEWDFLTIARKFPGGEVDV